MDLTFGSVCSGIEAASVASHPLGWRAAWLAEVDRAASEVLAYRFPDVSNLGDMTTIAARIRSREVVAPDVLVGGTPCQSFSLAGLRKGLADSRGQLTLAFVDLADAIDEIRAADGKPPVIVVWENVPGVLTHKDNPFGCFLAGLAGEDDPLQPAGKKWTNAGLVCGPQRAASWRTLDAQWFGLAQRRRRVFVVASAREGFDPGAILLEFEGVRRDSAPRREAGEGFTGTPVTGATGGGFPGTDGACAGHDVPYEHGRFRRAAGDVVVRESGPGFWSQTSIAGSLRVGGDIESSAAILAPVPTWWDGRDVSQTLDAVLHKGQTMPEKNRFPAVLQPVTGFSVKDYGGDAASGLDRTLRSMGHSDSHPNGGGQVGVAYAIQERAICENPAAGPDGVGVRSDDCAYTMESRQVPQAVAYDVTPFDTTQITSPHNYSNPKAGDTGHPLAAGAHPPAVCVMAEGFDASEDGTGRGQPIVAAVALRGRDGGSTAELGDDVAGCLRASSGGGDKPHALVNMAVRRLMPVEAERLQGFPDGWTDVPTGKSGKRAADGPRYKQLGNSMAVPVMRWIFSRIDRALSGYGHNGGPPLDDFDDLL